MARSKAGAFDAVLEEARFLLRCTPDEWLNMGQLNLERRPKKLMEAMDTVGFATAPGT